MLPGKDNPKLIVESNCFTMLIKEDCKTRWRCTNYFRTKCNVTFITYGNVVQVNRAHNHFPNFFKRQNLNLKKVFSQIISYKSKELENIEYYEY